MRKYLYLLIVILLISGCSSSPQKIESESRTREYQQMNDGRPLTPISKDSRQLAIKGYDHVAFFTLGKGVIGNEKYSLGYNEAVWYFINEEHKNKFMKSPDKYLPQYGGYCAYGVAVLYEMPPAAGDGRYWDIKDGKLYLKYNKGAQVLWRLGKKNMIYKADIRWEIFLELFEKYNSE